MSLQARAALGAAQAREYGDPFLGREVLAALGKLDLGSVTSLGFELANRKRTYTLLIQPGAGVATASHGEQHRLQIARHRGMLLAGGVHVAGIAGVD